MRMTLLTEAMGGAPKKAAEGVGVKDYARAAPARPRTIPHKRLPQTGAGVAYLIDRSGHASSIAPCDPRARAARRAAGDNGSILRRASRSRTSQCHAQLPA